MSLELRGLSFVSITSQNVLPKRDSFMKAAIFFKFKMSFVLDGFFCFSSQITLNLDKTLHALSIGHLKWPHHSTIYSLILSTLVK